MELLFHSSQKEKEATIFMVFRFPQFLDTTAVSSLYFTGRKGKKEGKKEERKPPLSHSYNLKFITMSWVIHPQTN